MSRRDVLMGACVRITPHAERRVRERLGVPRRAVLRMAERALAQGVPAADQGGQSGVAYGQFLWIFDAGAAGLGVRTLVTVLPRRSRYDMRVGLIEAEDGARYRQERVRQLRRRQLKARRASERVDASRRAAGGV